MIERYQPASVSLTNTISFEQVVDADAENLPVSDPVSMIVSAPPLPRNWNLGEQAEVIPAAMAGPIL